MRDRSCSNPRSKPLRSAQFALQRKTGYISPYSLGMLYPSYRKGRLHPGGKGGWVSPILVKLPFGPQRWFRVPPAAIRFPSWIARKVTGCDAAGFSQR